MKLSRTEERYIVHWGEMGTRWGVNRTVSQIFALLYLSDKPLNAEEIAETLSVARSNVSTSLKELQSWGLVRATQILGDRRDHFEALQDIWDISKIIIEQRRARELDPTLTVLRECMLEDDPNLGKSQRKKIKQVLEFLELVTHWHNETKSLPKSVVMAVMKLGTRIQKLVKK